MDNDEVTQGDLDSSERGSGARKSAGKPQLDLIPIRFWIEHWEEMPWEDDNTRDLMQVLHFLAAWQEGDNPGVNLSYALRQAMHWSPAGIAVFEFGAEKYARWNWAKGMPWRIPVGCILRHARQILEFGEMYDQDSGETHYGHILCNIIMLAWYEEHYPEGDDRPIFPKDIDRKQDIQNVQAALQRNQLAAQAGLANQGYDAAIRLGQQF